MTLMVNGIKLQVIDLGDTSETLGATGSGCSAIFPGKAGKCLAHLCFHSLVFIGVNR